LGGHPGSGFFENIRGVGKGVVQAQRWIKVAAIPTALIGKRWLAVFGNLSFIDICKLAIVANY
jgi:hypothetical protein